MLQEVNDWADMRNTVVCSVASLPASSCGIVWVYEE